MRILFILTFLAALILSLHHWIGSVLVLTMLAISIRQMMTPAERRQFITDITGKR